MEIKILPEADDFLTSLAAVLVNEGYKPTYKAAEKIVDDILDYISRLELVPHYRLPLSVKYHFIEYGEDLWYAFFTRKSSPHTTWYVFFTKSDHRILVKHISNNWLEGQYIR